MHGKIINPYIDELKASPHISIPAYLHVVILNIRS